MVITRAMKTLPPLKLSTNPAILLPRPVVIRVWAIMPTTHRETAIFGPYQGPFGQALGQPGPSWPGLSEEIRPAPRRL